MNSIMKRSVKLLIFVFVCAIQPIGHAQTSNESTKPNAIEREALMAQVRSKLLSDSGAYMTFCNLQDVYKNNRTTFIDTFICRFNSGDVLCRLVNDDSLLCLYICSCPTDGIERWNCYKSLCTDSNTFHRFPDDIALMYLTLNKIEMGLMSDISIETNEYLELFIELKERLLGDTIVYGLFYKYLSGRTSYDELRGNSILGNIFAEEILQRAKHIYSRDNARLLFTDMVTKYDNYIPFMYACSDIQKVILEYLNTPNECNR